MDALPSGTVSFCFTDIEGSTKLFTRLGARYASLQDRHRGLIREAAARFGGVEIKTEGDGCFLAFQDAVAAVKAAGAMQHAIDQHGWPRDARIRVRIGVHTGEAQPAGRDYVALAVHQAARVADSGHGGQVVVSAQTAAHVEPSSIEPFHLADLGEYRLRSFDEACHLFQLAGPGLAGAFPPLRTRSAVSRRVRIFLSSPGDVRAAREIAALTVERLAQDYARFFTVEAYFWDHEAMLASGHFQDPAEPPSAFDIVVLIVWSRLGASLPERTPTREYRGGDGRAPLTGTEWVFEEALQAARMRGAPDLLVYRSLSPASFDLRDSQLRDRQLHQLTAVDRFWSEQIAAEKTGAVASTQFTREDEFAEALERHLRQLIEKRIAAEGASSADQAVKVWKRTPFRGLEAYEFEHAAIFFGQDEALTAAMVRLVANAEAGSPFLVVLGASGSGKSSLVKAGIVPKLFAPRRIPGAAFLRRIVFRPSDAQEGEDLFDALARRLTTQAGSNEGLSELVGHGQSVAGLAGHLRNAATEPAYPIGSVLGRLTAEARQDGRMLDYESAKVVLVLDQLEELFTNELLSHEQRQHFVALLAGLVRSGFVWIVATMRSDFWHRAAETPDLMNLAQGQGRLELWSPTPSQLGQMIRRPAEAAGIGFEPHAGTDAPLNEVIAEAVAREPGALPLLSYLLDQLYRRDVLEAHGDALTFATYESLGKLEGAIAAKAEAVLAACAPSDREALGSVLFALVQMGAADGEVERAIARRVPLSAFPEGTPQRRLVEALLDPDARLLVSDAGKDGNSTIRVAHEALITHWTRARDFVLGNAEALRIRRRIEERYILWRGGKADGEANTADSPSSSVSRLLVWLSWSGRQRGLLSEIDLADGQHLLSMHRSQIEPHLAAYIERSAADEKRVRTRSFRVLAGFAGVVAILAVVAFVGQHEAQVQARRALQAQSRLLTQAAAERLARGDVAGGEGIILEVLADPHIAGPGGAAPAVSVFQEARAADGLLAVLSGHGDIVATAAYSPDGRRVVTGSMDKTARVWDAATGAQLAVLSGHGGTVESATFSPDGRRIVTASDDKTARIWDASTGKQLAVLAGQSGMVSAAFSPDERRIVTGSFDKTARIWDAVTGAPLALLSGHRDAVECVAYSPDGRRIATASDDKTVRIWDSATGAQLAVVSGHGGNVEFVAYSPDGRRIVTASADRTARIWDAASGAQLAVLSGHGGVVNSAAYSPDGRRIVTASNDKTARVWDAASGAQLAVLSSHDVAVEHAAFSPDGRRIVTAQSDKTARIWDAASGAQLAMVLGHGGAVTFAAYAPDGRRIVTTSWDKTARIWDSATGAQLTMLSGHGGTLWSAAYSPDGRRIVTASDDNTARTWDAVTGAPLAVFSGHGGGVRSAVFSPSGRRVLTASFDKTSRLWNAASGAPLAVIAGHGGGVYRAAFSPDGARIVTASDDRTARVWDAVTGKQLLLLSGHDGFVRFAAYSPDGRRIVTASNDNTARIWDSSTGAQLAVLSGHDGPVYSADWSPDGERIVTASVDRTARIWDAGSATQLAVLSGHEGTVFLAGYSPDGQRIVTVSDDKTIRLWDARIHADLSSQIAWARAAQVDPLSEVERSALGLPPLPRARAGARSPAPYALGRSARREEISAIEQTSTSRKDALLLAAFQDYAAAVARAKAERWPEDAWRHWRYRGATLARVLARDGMMRQVADAYDRVSRP